MQTFPFHFGTIKTLKEYIAIHGGFRFPFHFGTIKTESEAGEVPEATEVSIPLWYD